MSPIAQPVKQSSTDRVVSQVRSFSENFFAFSEIGVVYDLPSNKISAITVGQTLISTIGLVLLIQI